MGELIVVGLLLEFINGWRESIWSYDMGAHESNFLVRKNLNFNLLSYMLECSAMKVIHGDDEYRSPHCSHILLSAHC